MTVYSKNGVEVDEESILDPELQKLKEALLAFLNNVKESGFYVAFNNIVFAPEELIELINNDYRFIHNVENYSVVSPEDYINSLYAQRTYLVEELGKLEIIVSQLEKQLGINQEADNIEEKTEENNG